MMNSFEFLKNKISGNDFVTLDGRDIAELLTYIVNDITTFSERLKTCEHMLYLDDETFENLKEMKEDE